MSDAYGTIVLAKSDNCVIDQRNLLVELNGYAWGNHNTEWIFGDDDLPSMKSQCIQYPTVFNLRKQFHPSLQEVHYFNENEVDFAEENDSDNYPSLKEIATVLSPHIHSGWIEIAAVANEKCCYVYFERLKVLPNFRGMRSRRVVSVYGNEQFIEIV